MNVWCYHSCTGLLFAEQLIKYICCTLLKLPCPSVVYVILHANTQTSNVSFLYTFYKVPKGPFFSRCIAFMINVGIKILKFIVGGQQSSDKTNI